MPLNQVNLTGMRGRGAMTPWTSKVALCLSLSLSLLLSLSLGSSTAAPGTAVAPMGAPLISPHTPAGRWVPSGAAAFDHISRKPDALGIQRTAVAPAPSTFMHYQGIARVDAADGTPYFIISKGGVGAVEDEPGYLLVARMGSRDRDGERLRTNLWYNAADNIAQDQIVAAIPLDGTNNWPAFRHPGGMQLVGDVLAIGVDTPFNGESHEAAILFVDVSDPAHPKYLGKFNPPDPSNGGFGTDPVGMTAIETANGTCCRYMLVAAGGDGNEQVRFFQSGANMPDGSTDLARTVHWAEVGRYHADTLSSCMGTDWPTSGLVPGGQHQMLNFVREGGLDGQLYLIGGRRDGTIANPIAAELLDMYAVNLTADGLPTSCPLSHHNSREVSEEAWGYGQFGASFSAGSGVHVSPSGELLIYVTTHHGDPVLKVGEFRLWRVARDNSPTLRPTATPDGPFVVDEGASVQLTGQGSAAKTKAFVQLFEDGGSGSSIDQAMMIVDYPERASANFGNLATVQVGACDSISAGIDCFTSLEDNEGTLWQRSSSVRWFAPPGCTISLNDFPLNSATWPGPSTVLLRGSGAVEETDNLGALQTFRPADEAWPVSPVPSGTAATSVSLDDDIEGVTFFHDVVQGSGHARVFDCDDYYDATIGLGWDLDSDGSYDATGTSASFSASALDGPTTATVAARAQHPTDTSLTGTGEPISVPVTVRNVAPAVTSATLSDSLGHDLAGPDSLALSGLPVSLVVQFTDPGIADHQTARVDWGDGSSSTTFSTFHDARGGVVGELRQSHVFPGPGTYDVATTLIDDDQGTTTVHRTVVVVSAADLVDIVANRVTTLIGQSTSAAIITALTNARDELIGNHGGSSSNGAVDKLRAGDPTSAITKLMAAIADLQTAEAAGAGDLSAFEDLLGLTAEAIATEAQAKARDRFPTPTTSQAAALQGIGALITQGHQKLVLRQYPAACDNFRQATEGAVALSR